AELVAARRGGALLLPRGVDPVTQGLMVNAQLTGDLPQRPVRREDQLYGVLTELLGVVRGTGHLNILPQTTVWFQGVRYQGGTSESGRNWTGSTLRHQGAFAVVSGCFRWWRVPWCAGSVTAPWVQWMGKSRPAPKGGAVAVVHQRQGAPWQRRTPPRRRARRRQG